MKFCETHGDKYQIDYTSVLCVHPSCTKKLVQNLVFKSKSLTKLHKVIMKFNAEDDMIQYLIERLLIENKEDNKPYVINKTWLFFSLNRFIRDEMIEVKCEADIYDAVSPDDPIFSVWFKRYTGITPEDILITKDLTEYISKQYGNIFVSYLLGLLNINDMSRILGSGLYETKKLCSEIETKVKNIILNGD